MLKDGFVVNLIHPKCDSVVGIKPRSTYRLRNEETIKNGVAMNPFLMELRYHELMEKRQRMKLPLCL